MIVNSIINVPVYYMVDCGILASGGKRPYKGAKWREADFVVYFTTVQ